MKKVWIFVIAVGVISGLGLDQVMGQTVTVPVPGNVAWTDTGLVVQAGDHITITASGTIQYASDGSSSGPDGQPANGNGCLASFLVFCAVPNSLVGFIGSAPSLTLSGGFYVGSSFSGAATTSGKLFLGFNDGFVMTDRSGLDGGGVGDNSGSFTADVTVGQTVTVPVPGNVAWTDTGLVVQAGDHITITASGTIQYASDGSSSGPDGQPANGNGCLASFLVFCAVPNSLVGFIGSAPSLTLAGGFYVGSSFSGAATTSGKLFLGFNDGFVMTDRSGLDGGGVGDNSGSFTAKAAVGRSMGQFFGPALPTIVLTLTGCTSCTTGNTFSVQATVNNPSPIPVNVEVKAGVAFPDGTEASLWFANDKHFEVSLAAGVNSTVELLNVTVPLGLPTGQWVYEATLLSPETGRLLHRDWKSFTIH